MKISGGAVAGAEWREKKSAGKLSIRTFKETFFFGALKSEKSINESRAFKFLIKKRFRRKIDAQRFADNDIERGFARVMEKFVNWREKSDSQSSFGVIKN